MNLGKLMGKRTTDLHMKAKDKQDAIRQMAEMLYKENRISSLEVFIADVYRREELGNHKYGYGSSYSPQ